MRRAMDMKFDEGRILARARTYDWAKSAKRLMKALSAY